MIPGDPLSLLTLILLGLTGFVLGVIPGALVLRLCRDEAADRVEDSCAAFAAPGLGMVLFGALSGGVVWTLGRYSPVLIATVWVTLCAGLALLDRRGSKKPGSAAPLSTFLWAALVFVGAAVIVFWPVRDFPVSPDYDGTADAYLSAIVSLDHSYPRFRPFGDEFIKVTIPPSAAVFGAFLSDLSGVFPGRVQLALAGTAGVLYFMALPWAGWPILRRFTAWPWLAVLPGLLGYQWLFKVIYYDGSNLRLYGALGLTLATGFWLRATEGRRSAAILAGVVAGSTLYFHHRFFLYAGISGAAHVAFESVRALVKRDARAEWKNLMMRAAAVAVFALLVAAPFLIPALPHASATSSNALWAQSRLPTFEGFVTFVDRTQGRVAFFGTPVAALLTLLLGARFPAVRFLGAACLGQSLFAFEEVTHAVLPMLASYLDRADLATSAFLESRPILFGTVLAVVATRASSWLPRVPRAPAWMALGLAAAAAGVTFFRPMPFCYTYLSRGDYAALSWIRDHTPRDGTLVLAYAYDDVSNEEMRRVWPVPNPRASFNAETFWVAPVSNRRAVFHWVNRHTHQKAWSTLSDFSPNLPGALSVLNEAYTRPDLPASAAAFRKYGVTHLFYPFYMHLSFQPALLRAPHLRQVYLAPPPIDIAFGRESAPPREASPSVASAVYEVLQ